MSFFMSLTVLLSKLAGFAREMIVASTYGAGVESDAYNYAYGVVYITMTLIYAYVNTTFVPTYLRTIEQKGKTAAHRFASNILNLLTIVAIVLAVVLTIASPLVVRLSAPGFEPERADLATSMLRIMFPMLPFLTLAFLMSALLNARQCYIPPKMTGFPLSICVIIACLVFGRSHSATMLAWATLLSAVIQVVMQLPWMRRYHRHSLIADVRDDNFKKTLTLAVPALLSSATLEINQLVDKSLSSSLPLGSVASLGYASRLLGAISGILVVPMITVLYTKVSLFAAQKDYHSMIEYIRECVERVLLIMLPIAVITIICNVDFISLVYKRGQFDDTAVSLTSRAYIFYIVAVIFSAFTDIFNRAFYALRNTKAPMLFGIISVTVNIVSSIILVQFFEISGIVMGTLIAGVVSAGLLLFGLRVRLGRMNLKRTALEIFKMFVAGALCGIATWIVQARLPFDGHFARLAVCAAAGGIVYLLVAFVLRTKSLRLLVSAVTGKLKRT